MKFKIKVVPSSSRDCIVGCLDETIKIKVKAPPDNGKANKAVITVLEKSLSLARGSARITGGLSTCRKTVEIEHLDEATIRNKLADICSKSL